MYIHNLSSRQGSTIPSPIVIPNLSNQFGWSQMGHARRLGPSNHGLPLLRFLNLPCIEMIPANQYQPSSTPSYSGCSLIVTIGFLFLLVLFTISCQPSQLKWIQLNQPQLTQPPTDSSTFTNPETMPLPAPPSPCWRLEDPDAVRPQLLHEAELIDGEIVAHLRCQTNPMARSSEGSWFGATAWL